VAEQRVRTDLVLDAVAEAEGVQVPAPEIEEQVQLLTNSPTLTTKERRRLLASDGLRQRIERSLRRRHTMSRLLEIARPPDLAGDLVHSTTVEGEIVSGPAPEGAEIASQSIPDPAVVSAAQEHPSDQHNEQEN
jgi:hypothetical protein